MPITKPSALILDRDGTILAMTLNAEGKQDSAYWVSQIELYPELAELLLPWVKAGVPIFLATNQPGIAKGNFTDEELQEFHKELALRLNGQGTPLKGIYVCRHHPEGKPEGDASLIDDCACRKPKPGLLFQIQEEHAIALEDAIFIGDSKVDMDAASAAGITKRYLVRRFISEKVPKEEWVVQNPDAPDLKSVLKALQTEL